MAIPSSGYDTATITNPTSALTDFTLIVDLSRMSTDWWSGVNTSDGTRGRASKDDGTTELACDWIDFDDTAETGLLRVKWSGTLASSGTQVIRIYPPNTANTAYGVSDTYGQHNAYDSSWISYYPLQDDGSDRTLNQHNGIDIGTISYGGVSGKFGSATNFDGSNAVNLGDSFLDGLTELTLSIWFNTNTTIGEHSYISCWDVNDQILFEQNGSNVFGANRNFQTVSAAGITSGVWMQGVLTLDSSTFLVSRNTSETSISSTISSIAAASADLRIADNSNGTKRFDGQLQDAQIHSTTRALPWRTQEYSQTNDNATFWGTWAWNAPGGAFTLDADSGTFSITGSDVSLTADRQIQAESGTYNITGSAVDLLATRLIGADSGTYALTGSDVSLDLSVGFTLNADSGTFTINGSDVSLDRTFVLNADSGAYNLTGSDVILDWSGEVITFYKSVAINGDMTTELEVLGSITISKSILGEIG